MTFFVQIEGEDNEYSRHTAVHDFIKYFRIIIFDGTRIPVDRPKY